jgi:hypothetical protein
MISTLSLTKIIILTDVVGFDNNCMMQSWLTPTEKMPVLFLGHGSPMNAIEENQFVRRFREIVK